MSAMPLLKPLMIAPITITTMTPIATPRIVRAARALWARSDSSAMPTPSSKGVRRSLLAQRRDGIEPGRPAGRIHARHDADPAADLAGPLRDRHQHDVHDHDAADHERDAHQSGPDDVEDPAELLFERYDAHR